LKKTLKEAFKWTIILEIGSSCGLWFLGKPIVALLFEHGRFTSVDTAQTALALGAYGIGLLAFNGVKVFVQAFYAIQRVWIPSAVSLGAIALNYIGNSYLAPKFGAMGLAATTSVTSFINLGILFVALQVLGYKVFSWSIVRVFVASLLSGLSFYAVKGFGLVEKLLEIHANERLVFSLLLIALIGILGVVYMSLVAVMTPEGRILFTKLKSKLSR